MSNILVSSYSGFASSFLLQYSSIVTPNQYNWEISRVSQVHSTSKCGYKQCQNKLSTQGVENFVDNVENFVNIEKALYLSKKKNIKNFSTCSQRKKV